MLPILSRHGHKYVIFRSFYRYRVKRPNLLLDKNHYVYQLIYELTALIKQLDLIGQSQLDPIQLISGQKRARLFALIWMVQMRKIQGKNLRLTSLMRTKQSFVQYRISQNKKFYMAKFNVIRAVATTFETLTIYMKQYIRIRFLIDKPALNIE